MMQTTTWKHNFTNYSNLENINSTGQQNLKIFQPLASKKVRLQLNNLYDEVPLKITSLTIQTDSSAKKTVTLNGASHFEIPARLIEWSDWIDIDLKGEEFISIDLVSPNKTIHTSGMTISNDLIKTVETDPLIPKYFFGVSATQVEANQTHQRIAFFGDSLTNQGNFSAPLALDLETNFHIMTANYGISGNRLLHPGHSTSQWSTSFGEAGFTRFDHMLVDYKPDIVIFMEGVNDLLHPGTGSPISEFPSAAAIVKANWILRNKCKQNNATFVPMNITPADGNINGDVPAWNETKEKLRLEINSNLMNIPHILDLNTLVGQNSKLKSEFDCGDHVHFSAQGGRTIAKYIKEQLIRKKMI